MKKMIFFEWIIIVLASLIFVSCSAMRQIAISEDNLTQLKGKWTGSRNPDARSTLNTDLEISNDSFPIQGRWILHGVRMPDNIPTTDIINFQGGTINDRGNLLIINSAIEAELSLYRDGDEMWLWGTFSSQGGGGRGGGTMMLKKK